MQPISRRLFLLSSVAVVVAACSDGDGAAPSPTDPAPTDPATTDPATTDPAATDPATTLPPTTLPPTNLPADPFTLGVASGDPTSASVVLWTRLAPDPLNGGGMPADDVAVTWELSATDTFASIDATGTVMATAAHAHSVHALITPPAGTGPGGGRFFYRFQAAGYTSPVGVTAFAPAAGEGTGSVRFASASCQHYESGFYVAHRDLAAQQPDFVVFLGDYIYEGAGNAIGSNDNVRTHETDECTTLAGYRDRYALYKSDPDLQAAHAAAPWLVIWDDHEVENNYAGLVPQNAADAAGFEQRRRQAYQAWWEHQPVALPAPPEQGDYPIYRSMQWGGLITLALVDGRQYRTDQACGDPGLSLDPACQETFDETRTMLGDAQEQWLLDVLATSTSTWNVIGNQTVFGDVTLGGAVLNYDQWDGYPAERNRIVESLDPSTNTVVLTGDIHFAGVGNIRTGGRGVGAPVAVEFVATSISSGGLIDPAVTDLVKSIPDIVDVELLHRGYILHELDATGWTAQYRMMDTVKAEESASFVHATYRVEAGTNTVAIASI